MSGAFAYERQRKFAPSVASPLVRSRRLYQRGFLLGPHTLRKHGLIHIKPHAGDIKQVVFG